MIHGTSSLGKFLALPLTAGLLLAVTLLAQDKPEVSAPAAKTFDALADQALAAMKALATEMNVKGVAVVSCSEGERVQSWSSKMLVVGKAKTDPSPSDPAGSDLIAIAYSKSAEMADTLKASGSGVRPPMKGEFGWQGGVIGRGKSGYLIVAFSGGASAQDVKISQAGLAVLAKSL
jgi:hypothetical protein